MQSHQLITTQDELTAFCQRLASQPWLTVDTEFVRERTYYAELSLIQVGCGDDNGGAGEAACIDPLALDDLSPLTELLSNPESIKVFHAADQDIEILYRALGKMPAPLFDTQAAATLLGYGQQIGYANLVQKLLDISVDKSQTRLDWNRRPLPPEALDYAQNDVTYLAQIYPMMVAELEKLGRLDWLKPELDKLCNPASYAAEPTDAWQRLRGFHKLKPRAQAIAMSLCAWREQMAKDKDRPRGHIVRDDCMLDIAARQPGNLKLLGQVRGMPGHIVDRHGKQLLALMEEAKNNPPPPQKPRPKPLNDQQDAVVDFLLAIVKLRAAAEQITPATLVSRKHLEELVRGERDLAVLEGWRRPMIGEALLSALAGEVSITVDNGQLALG